MKFTIIKSCLARFSGVFAVGTPSNIHGTAISYRCAKFGTFVNSVTILTLRDLTMVDLVCTMLQLQDTKGGSKKMMLCRIGYFKNYKRMLNKYIDPNNFNIKIESTNHCY